MVFTARLKEHLKKNDVGPADVTKVLLLFKFCAWCTWIGLIPFCSKLRPLRTLVKLPVIRQTYQKLITKYPTQYKRYEEHVMRTSEWFGSRNWVKWIPDTFGQKHKDFGLAVGEATVMYKLTFILWAPAEFMAIVRWYAKKRRPLSLGDSYQELTQNYKHLIESKLDSYQFLIDPSNQDESGDSDDDGTDDGSDGPSGGSGSAGKMGKYASKAGKSVGGRNASVTAFGLVDYSRMKVPFSYSTQESASLSTEGYRLVPARSASSVSSTNTKVIPSKDSSSFIPTSTMVGSPNLDSMIDFDSLSSSLVSQFDFNPDQYSSGTIIGDCDEFINRFDYPSGKQIGFLSAESYAKLLQLQFLPQSSLFGLNLTSFRLYYYHCFSVAHSNLSSGGAGGTTYHSADHHQLDSSNMNLISLSNFRQLFHSNGVGSIRSNFVSTLARSFL